MQVLDEIREVHGRSDRYEVVIGGVASGVLSSRDISELSIRVGGAVDEALSLRIRFASDCLAAYDAGIAVLARSSRSIWELRRRLMDRVGNLEAVEKALSRLQIDGVAGDDLHARHYVRSRLARGIAPAAIIGSLLRVSVPRSTAEAALAEVMREEEWDEEESARRAASRKIRSLLTEERGTARRRLVAYMRRKGFSAMAVRVALQELDEARSSQ